MKCLDYCDDGIAEFHDPRFPPLDTDICLCKDCYIVALEDMRDELECELEELNEKLEKYS